MREGAQVPGPQSQYYRGMGGGEGGDDGCRGPGVGSCRAACASPDQTVCQEQ